MLRTPALLSEALLAHDVIVCLERSSGALSPDSAETGCEAVCEQARRDRSCADTFVFNLKVKGTIWP